ncbi:AbrB/MazE/SpoVT family DNA-binding domain-containing protein [Terrihalobacillus insolitus]|uniref:AbrB/MazE/SpoVT family DNA-binding domain-containing protein n=1 Tax=Terrihalobacillus insolitus TaxID=2950438 RepID=UPI00234257B9|nr:AbrB/MazE/SpoVT family DNA-binding domain-containing protein [Terrihalobacillus insolitus]MDC3412873.1 AbrB/MazE/SpoVT family DNA-binding domain-containing protein [Terrihalobacillus insolitus]
MSVITVNGKREYRKVTQLGNSLAVGIPKSITEILGISKGDELEFSLNENNELVLRPNRKNALLENMDMEMIDMLYETFSENDELLKSLKDK